MAFAWALCALVAIRQSSTDYARVCRSHTEPVTVTLDGESLQMVSEYGSRVVRGSGMRRVDLHPRSVVLELVINKHVMLPRARLSTEEVATLERWARGSASSRR